MKAAICMTVLFATLSASATSSPTAKLSYTLSLQSKDGQLTSATETLAMRVGVGQTVSFALPGAGSHALTIDGIEVKGARVLTDGPRRSVLRVKAFAPRIEVTYHLQISQPFGSGPADQSSIVQSDRFAIRGEDLLLAPLGCDECSTTLEVSGVPDSWVSMIGSRGDTSLIQVKDSFFLGGSNYQVIESEVDGAPLRVFYPGTLKTYAAQILSAAAEIVRADRHLWNAKLAPVNIGLLETADDENFSGRGFRGGIALYLGASVKRPDWLRLLAHESLHAWISRQIGGFPAKDPDSEAWLNEGFTEAYTARVLLESGLWSVDEFIDDWNASLVRYGTSPVKTEPNSRIVADRQRDFDVNRLPYDRGRLLAIFWDQKLRAKTHGRVGLTEVLKAQIVEGSVRELSPTKTSADVLFPSIVKKLTGLDLSKDLDSYVVNGVEIHLPQDAFGTCAKIESTTQPIFDRGFDFMGTLKAHGNLVGLEPGGPADRAGLREGDKIKIDEIPTHDSRVSLSYQVRTGENEWLTVVYRPVGVDLITFQQIHLEAEPPFTRNQCKTSMLLP